MTNNRLIMPAEWAPQAAVLVSWPHASTDWAYMLTDVQSCYVGMVEAIAKYAPVIVIAPDIEQPKSLLSSLQSIHPIHYLQVPTNDTWIRDYGPLMLVSGSGHRCACDFKFNGWGLKFAANLDNMASKHIVDSKILGDDIDYANHLSFVLEGGSIDIDSDGTILTTTECLMSPNRNGSNTQAEIEAYILKALGCKRMLWLDHGALEGDDTDSHVDTLARFLPGNIIAYTACDRIDDPHYHDLKQMEKQLMAFRDIDNQPYALVPLCIPDAICDDDGNRLPATYANFLLCNGALLLPVYGDAHYDQQAIDALKAAVGDKFEIVPLDCRALIQQHGSLHCATMQIPK